MKTKRVSFIIGKNGKIKTKPDKNGPWLMAFPPELTKGDNLGKLSVREAQLYKKLKS